MTALIELDGLTRRFGRRLAVDRVSFAVNRGDVVGVLGPNGAGKTTTLRMVAGFVTPDAGTARICGHDIRTTPIAARRCLGFLPEGAPLWPEMTPEATLRFAGRVRGLHGAALARAVDRAVDRTGLAPVRRQRAETLSKGFRRRVGLALALLAEPPVLVLDEPTDGLDPNQKRELRALIAELAPATAILISTHLLDEVQASCSRAVVIAEGRVVADGTPAALAAGEGLDAAFRRLTTHAA